MLRWTSLAAALFHDLVPLILPSQSLVLNQIRIGGGIHQASDSQNQSGFEFHAVSTAIVGLSLLKQLPARDRQDRAVHLHGGSWVAWNEHEPRLP